MIPRWLAILLGILIVLMILYFIGVGVDVG
jgi:hypothetical protein